METDGINALNPAPDVGGILPPQINRPGPVIDYLTRPMVPSPKSRRRDTLKGIAQFIPFLSGELAKAEGDKLGVALSGLDFLGAAGAPAKAAVKKGISSLNDDAIDTSYRISHQPSGRTDDAIQLDDLTKDISGNEGGYPDDFYGPKGQQLYAPGKMFADDEYGIANTQSYEKILESKNKPNKEITIYRAVPAGVKKINEGDFVTLSPKYAELHATSGYGQRGDEAGKVISKKVKVQDIIWDGNDVNEFGYFPKIAKKVEKPKKVKKLKPKETEQLFSGIESTKRESLDAPYKNPIVDLVNERPELTQLSKSALDPNEDGVVSLFRVYNLKEGQELLPEKGIASLSTDVAPALEIGQKMEFIRGGGFNPMSLGRETPEFTIERPAKLIRYEVPIERVKAHVPSLLDQVPARAANAEKNSKFMSASSEKEVLADLSGIQPAEIFDVPFRAGARYFEGSVPAYRPSPYDIEKGADPTRVLNYGLFRLFEEGRTPKGLMRDIMKSGSPKFRREPKSAYMSYKNYLAKVAADEANPSRRPASFSGDQKTYAELNPGVSPYQMYGPEEFPMPIASRPRAKQDYQDLLDAFEKYKKIKGIGSL